jgi:hypothetical protein
MLSINDFKQVTIDDKPIFDQHYEKYAPIHSDNVFTTIVSWSKYVKFYYLFLEDNLLIMTKFQENIRFRPPIGKYNKDLFKQLFELAKREGSDQPIGIVDNETKNWLSMNFPKLKFVPHRDYFDYVYLASNLAELPGKDYAKIRNRLNKFKRNFSYEIEKISQENMDEIKKFLKRWCLWKDCDSDPLLENEKKAILYSIAHFFDLELSGLVIKINDDIEAISVFEPMNIDTVVVHYEKGSPDFDGIYKAINAEVAKLLQNDFKFINREQDMGLPGLRQAKMSYRPHHMVEVYHINKNNLIF